MVREVFQEEVQSQISGPERSSEEPPAVLRVAPHSGGGRRGQMPEQCRATATLMDLGVEYGRKSRVSGRLRFLT